MGCRHKKYRSYNAAVTCNYTTYIPMKNHLDSLHFLSLHFSSREMIYLPDLSDDEHHGVSDQEYSYNNHHNQSRNHNRQRHDREYSSFEDGWNQNNASSNNNTLETMSARSFGFIKPTQKIRDHDMANRIRRHKSFFNGETSSAVNGKLILILVECH